MKCCRLAAVLCSALLLPVAGLVVAEPGVPAPGSWQAQAPALYVARSDQRTCSEPLQPPPLAEGRRLASVAWQYVVPPGAPLRAWLCQGSQCVVLPGSRGRSRGLAGLDASQSLRLCFLRERLGAALAVRGMQVLVEYR